MEFVNSHHPSHFKSTAAREKVRSHVTRRQHQQAREIQKSIVFTPPISIPPRPDEPPLFGLLKPGRDGLIRKRRSRRQKGRSDQDTSDLASADDLTHETPPTEISEVPGDVTPNPSLLFDAIGEHLQMIHEPLGWPALGISETEGHAGQDYMAEQCLAEPAIRYTSLLFGAALLDQAGILQPDVCTWLYHRARTVVREGLFNHKRKKSEAFIIAVGNLAFYECMFGSEERAYRVRRAEQLRLIAQKGGFELLDLPDAIKRKMIWEDAVMARQSNSRPMLGHDACIDHDRMWEALALWLPAQFAALMSDESTTGR